VLKLHDVLGMKNTRWRRSAGLSGGI